MRVTDWIASLMDVDRNAEFAGDDVDQFTSVIDLGGYYEFVTVICPIMVSGTVIPYIMRTPDVAEVPTIMTVLDYDAAGALIQTSATVSTATQAITFRIGGAQYLRLRTGANQLDDVTFYLKAYNRANM